ncbi:unnamed protein product [Sphenostylis stenocarpa]|uniref:Uncharacterized protein n=1 Tax=Sphenostylis stenocarpa TaxID=92480 RepID=A0AA86SKA8_9FABA|nr:unnamed protein product [Sphenostylis stenocarpa]
MSDKLHLHTKDAHGHKYFSDEFTWLNNSPTKGGEHHAQETKEIQYYMKLYAHHPHLVFCFVAKTNLDVLV